jgi:predicted RNase H-like HicB family nuclease
MKFRIHLTKSLNVYTYGVSEAAAVEGSPREAIEVTAFWDDEAGVWVAESQAVPGLITEAETVEALLDKLAVLIPELLELNTPDAPHGPVPVSLKAERTVTYAL